MHGNHCDLSYRWLVYRWPVYHWIGLYRMNLNE